MKKPFVILLITGWFLFGVALIFLGERDILKEAKVIYKLEGERYKQITDVGQIKDGVYIIIR